LIGLLALLPPTLSLAQTCQTNSILATTPSSQFIDHTNGTVTDTKTGLMWKKCSEGQVWAAINNTCTGGAGGYQWQNALRQAQVVNNNGGFAGQQDWRVPNIKELNSITERQCIDPAINLGVFPNTSSAWFWSSSSNAYDGNTAHYINLIIGNGNWDLKANGHQLRLVRSGQ
jgi:hypothetical protein